MHTITDRRRALITFSQLFTTGMMAESKDCIIELDAESAAERRETGSALESLSTGRGYLRRALLWATTYTNQLREQHQQDSAAHPHAFRLRVATAADVGSMMGFIRELAVYELEPDGVKTTEASMLRDGFGEEEPLFYGILTEIKGAEEETWKPVAVAVVHFIYSTWEGRSLYLEDLYVSPLHRRQGISILNFTALARAADVARCARLQWSVLRWNTPAVLAYEALGATKLAEWDLYRLPKDDIRRVAWSLVSME